MNSLRNESRILFRPSFVMLSDTRKHFSTTSRHRIQWLVSSPSIPNLNFAKYDFTKCKISQRKRLFSTTRGPSSRPSNGSNFIKSVIGIGEIVIFTMVIYKVLTAINKHKFLITDVEEAQKLRDKHDLKSDYVENIANNMATFFCEILSNRNWQALYAAEQSNQNANSTSITMDRLISKLPPKIKSKEGYQLVHAILKKHLIEKMENELKSSRNVERLITQKYYGLRCTHFHADEWLDKAFKETGLGIEGILDLPSQLYFLITPNSVNVKINEKETCIWVREEFKDQTYLFIESSLPETSAEEDFHSDCLVVPSSDLILKRLNKIKTAFSLSDLYNSIAEKAGETLHPIGVVNILDQKILDYNENKTCWERAEIQKLIPEFIVALIEEPLKQKIALDFYREVSEAVKKN